MSKLSLHLQAKSLKEMADRKTYSKKLAGFEYLVLPKVYKGSTDTELFCDLLRTEKIVVKGKDVWDIGTGTGLIALQAKKIGACYVLATDLNPDAVKNAKENAKLLNLDIDVRQADVFGDIKKKFDLITFNPPFSDALVSERHHINFWDKDHTTVRKFLKSIHNYLKPNGRVLIAWSSFANTRTLKHLAQDCEVSLQEIGRRKGKRGFVYYVFVSGAHSSFSAEKGCGPTSRRRAPVGTK